MSKKWILLLGLVCCTLIAGLVFAEGAKWDAEAAKKMSRADRMAAQQAFKAEMEKAARASGWVPGKKQPFASVGRQAAPPNKVVGAIVYDTGALGTCCLAFKSIGNQFDTALNPAGTALSPVMMSGSITMASFFMADTDGGGAFITVFDQLAGTTANKITSFFTSMTVATNLKSFATPIAYVGSSFLAGVWQNGTGTDDDRLAVATGTVAGQGWHGMSISSGGGAFVSLGTLNGAFRVSGDVLTPVELLNFEVE